MRHEDVSVVVVASRVDVETVVVDKRGQFLENYPVPLAPAVLATAYQLYTRIRPFHYLGELNRLFGVILCAQGPDLPPPVQLVCRLLLEKKNWMTSSRVSPRPVAPFIRSSKNSPRQKPPDALVEAGR